MLENEVSDRVHRYYSASPPLPAPIPHVSRNYHSVLPSLRSKSATLHDTPAALHITQDAATLSFVDKPCSTEQHQLLPPASTALTNHFSPPLPITVSQTADAYAFIDRWLSADRPSPFLQLHCPPHIFASTATKLSLANKLPRLARDYNPLTQIWHIRNHAHILHEVAGSIQLGLRDLITPVLTSGKFASLAQRLVWGAASPTVQLPHESGGTKEPGSCVMLRGWPLPTIVIEVADEGGCSEEEEERKRKRDGVENGVGVMLVMLISYEGKRPSDDQGIAYSSVDEVNDTEASETGTDPESAEHGLSPNQKQLKPLSIWVEMWRLQPAPATRANPNTPGPVTLQPHLDERKQFFPSTTNDSVTILLQDVFGAEKVRNPGNAVKWNLPLSVFRKAYEERLEIFMAQIAAELGELEEDEEVLEAGPEDVDLDDTEVQFVVEGVENDAGGEEYGERKRATFDME